MTTNPANAETLPGSQTVRRAMEILRLVACGQELGVRLADIVHMSGLNRPTVHRILKTLIDEDAIEQDPHSRRYLIGPEMALLGIARTRRFPIMSTATTYLAELAQQVGDTAFLSIGHGYDSICIGRQTGHHPIQVLSIDVGARRPLGVGVSGVALLSQLTPEEVERCIKANAKRLELHHLSRDDLLERICTARQLGYAYVPVGVMPGTSAVAVPVVAANGVPLAAVTITAMSERLSLERLPHVLTLMKEQASLIGRHHDAATAALCKA